MMFALIKGLKEFQSLESKWIAMCGCSDAIHAKYGIAINLILYVSNN